MKKTILCLEKTFKNLNQLVIFLRAKKIRKNPYDNVTTRIRKILPVNFESRLKELPSLYTEISTDQTKKIAAAKTIFYKVIKQVRQLLKKDVKFITTTRIISQLTKNESSRNK